MNFSSSLLYMYWKIAFSSIGRLLYFTTYYVLLHLKKYFAHDSFLQIVNYSNCASTFTSSDLSTPDSAVAHVTNVM